jgi:hypothetical protein
MAIHLQIMSVILFSIIFIKINALSFCPHERTERSVISPIGFSAHDLHPCGPYHNATLYLYWHTLSSGSPLSTPCQLFSERQLAIFSSCTSHDEIKRLDPSQKKKDTSCSRTYTLFGFIFLVFLLCPDVHIVCGVGLLWLAENLDVPAWLEVVWDVEPNEFRNECQSTSLTLTNGIVPMLLLSNCAECFEFIFGQLDLFEVRLDAVWTQRRWHVSYREKWRNRNSPSCTLFGMTENPR